MAPFAHNGKPTLVPIKGTSPNSFFFNGYRNSPCTMEFFSTYKKLPQNSHHPRSPNNQLTKQAVYGRISLEPLAHSVEHRPFKASVLGSKPRRLTTQPSIISLSSPFHSKQIPLFSPLNLICTYSFSSMGNKKHIA